jgi:hypothetical protein
MKYRWPSVLWLACFAVGYGITFIHGFPAVKYYPAAHAWGLEGAYPDPGMAWFAKVATGCLLGFIGWMIGVVIAKIKGSESRPPLVLDIAVWVILCATAAYVAHFEWAKWM